MQFFDLSMKKKLSRRVFLRGVVLWGLGGFAARPFLFRQASAKEWKDKTKEKFIVVGSGANACLVNVRKGTTATVQIGFIPHSFIAHPTRPMRYTAVEKNGGQHCATIDFAEERIINATLSPEHTWFYGHGLYVKETGGYAITRVSHESGQGSLVIYDPETLKPGAVFDVTPGGLHQCQLLPDRTLMVTSSGLRSYGEGMPQNGQRVAKTAIVRVDMCTGKVLDRKEVSDEDQIIGHFCISTRGSILALSGPKPGAKVGHGKLYFSRHLNEELQEITMPPELLSTLGGEMLSVAISDDGALGIATSPMSATMFLVDMQTGKLLESRKSHASAVVYDASSSTFLTCSKILERIDPQLRSVQEIKLQSRSAGKVALGGAHALFVES